MPSITAWTRIEPKARRDRPDIGLQARIRDPLWLLARQWQFGEFAAEDAGSPIQARVQIERAGLTRYHSGDLAASPRAAERYDPARMPLEVLVEREPLAIDVRLACESGLHFLRMLEDHGLTKYRAAFVASYPIAPPPEGPLAAETARLLRLAAGRAPDGAQLAAALRNAKTDLPPALSIPDEDRTQVRAIADAWLRWLDELMGTTVTEAAQAWQPERLEYHFAVAAPAPEGEHVLVAGEHRGGAIDWHTFDLKPGISLGAQADARDQARLVQTVIPAPVRYPGMPVSRWWEFEDGQVNFGRVDAAPRDLLRLLLLGFALEYGNDWFVIPLDLPAGALYRIASLVVTDSFGERTLVRHYTQSGHPSANWNMFGLSAEDTAQGADWLFLTPSMVGDVHGNLLEEVFLLRDEVVNMAWAVEHLVEDTGGRSINRAEHQPEQQLSSTDSAVEGLHYRLSSGVPGHWFPLIPQRIDPNRPDIRLQRGRVLLEGSDELVIPMPLSRILEPGKALALFEEEVQRTGLRIKRNYTATRWYSGETHLWVRRRKDPGQGEGASRLRFDVLGGDKTPDAERGGNADDI